MVEVFETENEFGSGTVISWASLLDANCRVQAETISRVPIVEGHLALMPDAHFGFGPPVGSALKCRGAVMPYAVGVDIGCGMIAAKTVLSRGQLRGIESQILSNIRQLIPSGAGGRHKGSLASSRWEDFLREFGEPQALGDASLVARKKPFTANLP